MVLKFLKRKLLVKLKETTPKIKKVVAKNNSYSCQSIIGGYYNKIDNCIHHTNSSSAGRGLCPLDVIDDFVLLAIFHQLSANDVSNVRLVNRRWNRVVNENQNLLPCRRLEYASVHQRSDGNVRLLIVTKKNEERQMNCNVLDLPLYLSRVRVTRLDISGKLCDGLLYALKNVQVKIFAAKQAKISTRCSTFSQTFRLLEARSLILARCIFEDAQLISDQFFVANPQIVNVKILCAEERWQSFPSLTDRTLLMFANYQLPRYFRLNNVETGFSINGIASMIKSARLSEVPLRSYQSYQWAFGRILSNSATCRKTLSAINDITLKHIHETHFCVQSDVLPEIKALFFTKIEKISYKETYYYDL